ncbi:MAG: tetratricopeptide repeat protein, partial [Thermodesulfobacteriota bacterium]
PGKWSQGSYRVDLFIDGKKITSGSFEIYETPSVHILLVRGQVYFNESKYDDAIAEFTKAIELDPKYAAAYIYRGMAYDINKQYKNSVSDFDKFVELDSKDGGAVRDESVLLQKKG